MLELISVVRRCGKSVPLNIEKIRRVCEWACKGLDCSPLELEGSLTAQLKDGITTKEIQDNLINWAVTKCSPESPDWRYVAGRLHIWGYNQDVIASRGYGYESEDFNPFVYQLIGGIHRGKYNKQLWEVYSRDDLIEAQTWINSDWDYDYDYAGAVLLTNRYLQKDELIQEMYLITCLLIASVEKSSDRLAYAKHFYEKVAQRKISLATPILANLRAPDGNGTSCFIHTIEDNLDSIFDEIKNAAKISKNGGGIGTNLSKIRATGSSVMGKPNASGGVIPWVKILNDTAIAVNQGGKRAGAITVALDIWHYDVIEFLELQTENGDQRRKAYDIFPQLVIPDCFMKYVDRDFDWYLFDPYEVKEKIGYDLAELWGEQFTRAYHDLIENLNDFRLVKTVKAKDLMKQILKVQLESGLPYLWFKDTVNRANPNKHAGYIPNGNLCVAPETKILTDKGQVAISDLEGEYVNVWNGFEWSNVLVRKTGVNQKLLRVIVSVFHYDANGKMVAHEATHLDCTEYHKWYINGDSQNPVTTLDLKTGNETIRWVTLEGNKAYAFIRSVDDVNRFDDTYCFTEHKRHYGVFNGILTGQCQESYSNVKSGEEIHSCNLISINLATAEGDAKIDRDCDLMASSELSVRMLDNIIDLTTPPVKEAGTHNNKYRTIGVGFMGLADYLVVNGFSYKDLDLINILFERLSFACISASASLAKERGAYPAFEGSEWATGNVQNILPALAAETHLNWDDLLDKISISGIRNSHVMAIAPNTSSSLIHGCTASVLPVYKRFFYDKASKGAVPIAPPFIGDKFWHYQENITLDQKVVVNAVSTIQKWIDTGISMELVFNLNQGVYSEGSITAKDIFDTIYLAWEKGCKAIYYIRSVQKDSIKDECTTCAN